MLIMQITLFVSLSPMHSCQPLVEWQAHCGDVGVPDVSPPVNNSTPLEIRASGGGLLVEPINAPHVFHKTCGRWTAEFSVLVSLKFNFKFVFYSPAQWINK